MASLDELRARDLPKWPQMLVTGEPVTVEQAKEIIRRTDTFLHGGYGGNNRLFNEHVEKLLKCRKSWGHIGLEFVTNSWVSSAFVEGPHGWCHPTGRIGFVDNVGKWPSVQEVEQEWAKIAHEFSFLRLGVTLQSGESGEHTKSVVSMVVRNGGVRLWDPETLDAHQGHPQATRGNVFDKCPDPNMGACHYSLGLHSLAPRDECDEWARVQMDYAIEHRTGGIECQSPFELGLPYVWIEEWVEKWGG